VVSWLNDLDYFLYKFSYQRPTAHRYCSEPERSGGMLSSRSKKCQWSNISKVVATCYYQLRRNNATGAGTRHICNSDLSFLAQSTVEPLQRVQNAAARMIFSLIKRDHVTPCPIQLHWLPVRFRITYKLCVLMHNIHNGTSSCFLCEIVQSTSARTTCSDLRSCSATTTYDTPWLRAKFGQRAFSFAGPAPWNVLPTDLRSVSDSTVFKEITQELLLFRLAFNIQ